jgi:hypothetical protein
MPARSTPFQKLILHLQQELSPSVFVEESVLLRHRLTGELREVDIVLRSKVGEHTVNVSLECIEHSRPADVTWVEQIVAKHDHLETHKLVLVSLSGFTEQALKLAQSMGISTDTPTEALAQDWMKVIGKAELICACFEYSPIEVSLRIETAKGPVIVVVGPDTEVYRPDINSTGTLRELVFHVIRDHGFASYAMDAQKQDGSATVEFDFRLDLSNYAIDSGGQRHLIQGIHVKMAAKRESSPIPLTSISWNGVPAAFGNAITPLGSTTLTVIEHESGTLNFRTIVDGKELPHHQNFDNQPPSNVRFK